MTPTPPQPLRDLVAQRLNLQWDSFSREHPNLARAIDRVNLIDTTIDNLRRNPEYIKAMREADLDEAQLGAISRVLATIERAVAVALGL
ncbi:MAG: hypothetical protein GC164_02555 [Phycisphaera sp.]|nr:hypothetical protein [Phycisphaera sp.]